MPRGTGRSHAVARSCEAPGARDEGPASSGTAAGPQNMLPAAPAAPGVPGELPPRPPLPNV